MSITRIIGIAPRVSDKISKDQVYWKDKEFDRWINDYLFGVADIQKRDDCFRIRKDDEAWSCVIPTEVCRQMGEELVSGNLTVCGEDWKWDKEDEDFMEYAKVFGNNFINLTEIVNEEDEWIVYFDGGC